MQCMQCFVWKPRRRMCFACSDIFESKMTLWLFICLKFVILFFFFCLASTANSCAYQLCFCLPDGIRNIISFPRCFIDEYYVYILRLRKRCTLFKCDTCLVHPIFLELNCCLYDSTIWYNNSYITHITGVWPYRPVGLLLLVINPN